MARVGRRSVYRCVMVLYNMAGFRHFSASRLVCCALGAMGAVALMAVVHATELPSGVVNYLKTQDTKVNIRFDGVVTLANGDVYLPVLPQLPSTMAPEQVTVLGNTKLADHPDLISFNNGSYLIKIVRTATGKLALAKIDPYPIGLKEGILPQDLLLPPSLYIPLELKVILGNLPYNPQSSMAETPAEAAIGRNTAIKPGVKPVAKPVASATTPAVKPAEIVTTTSPTATPATKPVVVATTPAVVIPPTATNTTIASVITPTVAPERVIAPQEDTIYATQLDGQKLVRFILTGGNTPSLKLKDSLAIGCLPLTLHADESASHIAAPCLNTSEVVIVDTEAHAVQTRIAVDAPIATSQSDGQTLWLTHRTTNAITVIDLAQRKKIATIDPGIRGSAMAFDANHLYIGDMEAPTVLVWDRKTNKLVKKLPALPAIAALAKHIVNDTPVLMVASRTQHQVAAINLATGGIIRTLEVGAKPVGFVSHRDYPNVMWVISGGGHRVEQLTAEGTIQPWAELPEGSFPSQLVFLTKDEALLTAVGGKQAYLLEMDRPLAPIQTLTLPGRSNAVLPVGNHKGDHSVAAKPRYQAETMQVRGK